MPVSREKYTWSQGRWAWTCALVADEIEAGRLTGDAALWRDRSIRTADFLADHAFLPDGRTSFRLGETGDHLADEHGEVATSVFADLFAVLGLAGARRVAGEGADEWVAQARSTLVGADASLRDGTAKSAPYPVPSGFRDLAGPMTLVHVAGELHRAAPFDDAQDVITRARSTLLEGDAPFLNADTWWEFRPDRATDHDTLLARHVTPGHLLDLLWMLVHVGDRLPQLRGPGGHAHRPRSARPGDRLGRDGGRAAAL